MKTKHVKSEITQIAVKLARYTVFKAKCKFLFIALNMLKNL